MTQSEAAQRIMDLHTRSGREYTSITRLTYELDMTITEIHAALVWMARNTDFGVIPESNTAQLSEEDHANALWFGGQHKHVIYG